MNQFWQGFLLPIYLKVFGEGFQYQDDTAALRMLHMQILEPTLT